MGPNFASCGERFLNHSSDIYSNYTYNGTTRDFFGHSSSPVLMTVEVTINTWILPVFGLILQAPLESNQFWQNLWALARWIGNPIASFSYILSNIEVTGKCALMVDMSTKYNEVPTQDSRFAQTRDAFYILSIMNQCNLAQVSSGTLQELADSVDSINEGIPTVEAEKFLKIALFCNDLQLATTEDGTCSLVRRRGNLANLLRKNRKKGDVPTFFSLMWFMFSLVLSIQNAFGLIGQNVTAHNLAMGFLLGWVPVLVLSFTTERGMTSTDLVGEELNKFLNIVKQAFYNGGSLRMDTGRNPEELAWLDTLNDNECFRQNFFTKFAGHGLVRWHYGVAHRILASIERSSMASHKRNWLSDAEAAIISMDSGSGRIYSTESFGSHMISQILCAIFIVCGTVGGAFILSFFTPTAGLGCRSGGYLIFCFFALFIFAVELLIWYLEGLSFFSERIRLHRNQIERFFFRTCETLNSILLICITFLQTFGFYETCNCQAGQWGGQSGYIDFEDHAYYSQHGVEYLWGFATWLSCFVMVIALAFMVTEYCIQSHLSTENYDNAARGLRRTRLFRKYTYWFRVIGSGPFCCVGGSCSWTWKIIKSKMIVVVFRGGRAREAREMQPRRREGSGSDHSTTPSISHDRFRRRRQSINVPLQSV